MIFGQGSESKMHPKEPVDPFSNARFAQIWEFGGFSTTKMPSEAIPTATSPSGAFSIAKIRVFWGLVPFPPFPAGILRGWHAQDRAYNIQLRFAIVKSDDGAKQSGG